VSREQLLLLPKVYDETVVGTFYSGVRVLYLSQRWSRSGRVSRLRTIGQTPSPLPSRILLMVLLLMVPLLAVFLARQRAEECPV
jgi:hypothetical protein